MTASYPPLHRRLTYCSAIALSTTLPPSCPPPFQSVHHYPANHSTSALTTPPLTSYPPLHHCPPLHQHTIHHSTIALPTTLQPPSPPPACTLLHHSAAHHLPTSLTTAPPPSSLASPASLHTGHRSPWWGSCPRPAPSGQDRSDSSKQTGFSGGYLSTLDQ